VRVLPASVLLLASTAVAADAHKSSGKTPAAVNVTGTWGANFSGGMDLLLQQDGTLVRGKDNLGFLLRGDWRDGRLTLFYRLDFKGDAEGTCSAPVVAVLTSPGTATRLDGVEFLADGTTARRTLSRSSPAAGADFTYPYGAELKVCGSLPAKTLTPSSKRRTL